ncbi:hypothetical protein [Falsiroseomonas sp. HW251]|uniref:hypothetical protein n=1 Tax=Falsiroseomonas sp. HW251 TaxID=3390998 RepID=UPI003D31C962
MSENVVKLTVPRMAMDAYRARSPVHLLLPDPIPKTIEYAIARHRTSVLCRETRTWIKANCQEPVWPGVVLRPDGRHDQRYFRVVPALRFCCQTEAALCRLSHQ